jgi:squalene-hopene/tetraprenyl-beta-curcumene cyclase
MRLLPPTTAAHWDRRVFPDGLSSMQDALIARLAAHVSTDGAVRDQCRSRVLESALAFPLMKNFGQHPEHVSALKRYLVENCSSSNALEGAMIAAAIGDTAAEGSDLTESLVSTVPGFMAQRKRALIEAFGVMVGRQSGDKPLDDEAFALEGLHSWARVQMAAAKIVLAHSGGYRGRVDDEDVRVLLETQRTRSVWEGNIFIHILTLHALARLPQTESLVRAGVRTLARYQRADGGFPFVTDTDTWTTVSAAMALWSAGAPVNLLTRIARYLVRRQLPGGGWAYTDCAHQSDVDTTSVAVPFLHCLDRVAYDAAITQGIQSMLAVARPDGGFPTYIVQAPSEACTTAGCVDALSTRARDHADFIRRGLKFLATQQNDDGSFPLAWSGSTLHTIFRVLLAATRDVALADAHVHQMIARAMSYVIREQNADGGWGQQPGRPSDATSTAYGLIALCTQQDPRSAVRAVEFLMAAQRPDGSIQSLPDTVGPRPFVFAIPVLADAFTLLAIGHVSHRLEP